MVKGGERTEEGRRGIVGGEGEKDMEGGTPPCVFIMNWSLPA